MFSQGILVSSWSKPAAMSMGLWARLWKRTVMLFLSMSTWAEDIAKGPVAVVVGDKGKDAFLPAAALGIEVLLQQGVVAVGGDGVEIQVEGTSVLIAEVLCGVEP